MSADDVVEICDASLIPMASEPVDKKKEPKPFELEWRAASTQIALLSWNMSVDGILEPLDRPWVPFAENIKQRKDCEVFAVMDPSGRPLFMVGRLYHRDEHGDIDAAMKVYTVVAIERALGGRVELDYDAPATTVAVRRAFALAQERGADIILIGDTAKKGSMPLASLWLLTEGVFWYEKVVPVQAFPVSEYGSVAMPIDELRDILRRATWEGFKARWYSPSCKEFWPKTADIPNGSAMEAFRYLREKEMEWILYCGNMIYSMTYSSVVGHGGGPEPYDYVCMWRRPGFVGDFQPFNPVIRQFESNMGSWSDVD
jgi:hypothetical protein